MIEVKMTFSTADEVATFFNARSVEKITSVGDNTNPAPQVTIDLAKVPPVEEPAKEKKTRAKKEVQTPVAQEPEKESSAGCTIDDVRAALQDFVGRNDFAKGTALVQQFNKDDGTPAVRLTEVRECDYAAFIEATKVKS